MIEQELEAGEYYRIRHTNYIMLLLYIDNTIVKYAILSDNIESINIIDYNEFKDNLNRGKYSRLGKLSESELAKYLLRR